MKRFSEKTKEGIEMKPSDNGFSLISAGKQSFV